jgi:2-C-methyl-D-erythritol 4-phosphate cytidylyltransferase/2-C-methyl-D-erythritol 2,4-cyclodiphosphate synthase
MPRTFALIVAAGRGHRLGGAVPKQFLPLAGEPMLRRTTKVFVSHPGIDGVAVIIHPDDRALYDGATQGLDLLDPIAGGAKRQDSVLNGLEALKESEPDHVLIHDAARPFIIPRDISACIAALAERDGAILAVPVRDTLKRGKQCITDTVSCDGLWRAQTPQAFRYLAILAAHRAAAGEALTDDAAVAEKAGLSVALVSGKEDNLKVTTAEDVALAERMLALASGETRVGSGFDVHRFTEGDHVMLCGVSIPHDRALAGHSDADVALHALVDAILGALGASDIGVHFPPSDARWHGAESRVFVEHACQLVRDAGTCFTNVDLTVICERPDLGPHKPAMSERLAELLDLPVGRIGLKATTTEGLGFTGRGEGIAAQAVVSLFVA